MAHREQSSPPVRALWPHAEPSTVVLLIGSSIARADIPYLCEHVHTLLESGEADLVVCDVSAVVEPDAVTVEVLARLRLTACRLAREVRLRHASHDLRRLLDLMGLGEVLPPSPGLRLLRQAEERKEARGVEERVDPGDPPV